MLLFGRWRVAYEINHIRFHRLANTCNAALIKLDYHFLLSNVILLMMHTAELEMRDVEKGEKSCDSMKVRKVHNAAA